MIPQNITLLNLNYFNSIKQEIQNATSCSQLQQIVTQAYNSIIAQQEAALQQQNLLAPMQILLHPPSTPQEVIQYLTSFINLYLTPALKPYETYQAQNAALIAEMATIATLVAAASGKFNNCSISVPPIPSI